MAGAALICRESRLAVALAEGQPANYEIFGQLCYKPHNKNIVHVLLSGATAGRLYWDFPLSPQKYSYVQKITQAGYATFNFDRIGIGQSDHPPADQVTIQSNAFVARQIIQALRDGRLGTFSKIILVGHSLGSGIAIAEASQYGGVVGELNAFPPIVLSPAASQAIHVPVLVVIGQYDDLFSTPPKLPEAKAEPNFYSPDAQVEVKVIPNAGHVLNLHRNAQSVFATVLEWSNRRFGN
jgi:pimeloyl-ACP methyl ester carboxylesterase